jgi:tRNA pseudouridine38-40 synthase
LQVIIKKQGLRYFLEFAYKGTNYHGWQYQPNAITVQETLNTALSIILKTKIDLVGAGRTDTGVHAKQMYAHFDVENSIEIEALIFKANSFLPKDIALINLHLVHDEAHARFDATERTYHYHIHQNKNVFESDDSWYYHQNLDVQKMNQACEILIQHVDFECFSKVNTDVTTFNCKIYKAIWTKSSDQIVFEISADRFLRNMVRAIVGTMITIGLGKISLTDFQEIIDSKDRSKAGFSAPAHGLYLTKVKYPYIP